MTDLFDRLDAVIGNGPDSPKHIRADIVPPNKSPGLSDTVDDMLDQRDMGTARKGYQEYIDECSASIKETVSTSAYAFLHEAIKEMEGREDKYDTPEGERSMSTTVSMFNTLTDVDMTERQGWMFMTILKMVRAEYNGYREDDYVDGAAYFALGGESASKE